MGTLCLRDSTENLLEIEVGSNVCKCAQFFVSLQGSCHSVVSYFVLTLRRVNLAEVPNETTVSLILRVFFLAVVFVYDFTSLRAQETPKPGIGPDARQVTSTAPSGLSETLEAKIHAAWAAWLAGWPHRHNKVALRFSGCHAENRCQAGGINLRKTTASGGSVRHSEYGRPWRGSLTACCPPMLPEFEPPYTTESVLSTSL